MDRFTLLFVRLVMITAGFIVASLVAGTALALLTHVVTLQEANRISDAGLGAGLVVAAFAFASLTGYVAFFPSIAVILYSEFTQRRDWLFYALCGGAMAAIAPIVVMFLRSGSGRDGFDFFVMNIAAGMLGGLTYWLIAGRNAGSWMSGGK
ncbi:hypothetical protein [Hoeflea prorocentri]|uniref:Uncharacterized protein n=1 Tax=Hoeflea prorocentri TaxID=1922333 RepID=A0A9X3ZIW0_9HYPH|nr:hypothetical protein [Hoeflea prorocentri]MCY6383322.1 hypothetical protein [Hoeflea prorocentri]MDA5401122.1 hypothetical protein [Hoeflea prorocentri]